jgi:hypothetical protein
MSQDVIQDKDGDKKYLTPICPKDHIVFIRIIPALKKVEKQVFRLKIDITCVRPR